MTSMIAAQAKTARRGRVSVLPHKRCTLMASGSGCLARASGGMGMGRSETDQVARRHTCKAGGGADLRKARLAQAGEFVHAALEQAVRGGAIAADQRGVVVSGMASQFDHIARNAFEPAGEVARVLHPMR